MKGEGSEIGYSNGVFFSDSGNGAYFAGDFPYAAEKANGAEIYQLHYSGSIHLCKPLSDNSVPANKDLSSYGADALLVLCRGDEKGGPAGGDPTEHHTVYSLWVSDALRFSKAEVVDGIVPGISAVGIHGDGAAVFQAGVVRGG